MAVLRLLRNQTLYETHQLALEGIASKAQNLGDGEMWVATYGESPNAKSLLAIKRDDGVTIFDNEASSDAITAAINALDATVGSTTVASGKHVAVQITEVDGVLTGVTITENDIASAALLGTTSDTKDNATAFGYIAKEANDRKEAIEALDVPDTAEAKKFVTSVSETDGKISVSRGEVTSTDKTVTLSGRSDGGINLSVNIDDTTIVKDSDGKLGVASAALTQYVGENAINVSDVDSTKNEKTISLVIPESEKVLAQTENGLTSTIVLKSVTPTNNNVKEEYQLQGINGVQLGTDTIKVYKDQTLKSAKFENQILTLTYILADGSESLVDIDMSSIILETEVENGIQVNDHKLSIKLDITGDDTGEGKFLTVGKEGLKLNGVSEAIKNAIEALDVTAQSKEDTKKYVKTTLSETDGKVSNDGIEVVYGNYAETQKSGIATTEDTKTYVESAIAAKNVDAEGDDYVNATAANNKVTVKTQIAGLTFTQGSGTTDSTLAGTEKKLVDGKELGEKVSSFVNARISEEVAKLDAEQTSTDGTNIQVKVTEVDGKITAVSVSTDTTASKEDLDTEIAARKAVDGQSGQTYVANSSATYISDATSLNDADVKLDAALKTADDAMLTGVTGSNAITVSDKADKNQTISLKLDATTKPEGFAASDNVLNITDDGLYLSSVIDCGTY